MDRRNHILHGYAPEPICDAHIHIKMQMPVNATNYVIGELMEHFNYERALICSLPIYDRTDNYRNFYLKSKLAPKIYTAVGLDHHFDARDTAEYYLHQIKQYRAMGCDGVKMFEGKVFLHRKLGKKLCDPVYDLFYGYCEEHQIPITLHLGDPLDHWDITKMNDYALKNGWYCGPEDPTREELREEIDQVLQKFPNLPIVFAHFNYMEDEPERAAKMMDTYPNICFDLTPGGKMFIAFTKNWDAARAFFVKYQDRILYGTDSYNWRPKDMTLEEQNGKRVNLVRRFLEETEVFTESTMNTPFKPFGFSGEILDKIYRKNFIRLFGETPRPLDHALIAEGAKALLAEKDDSFTPLMTENLYTIIDHFEK